VGVTVLWGATFTLVRDLLEKIPPFLYISLRFWIAAATVGAFGGFRGLTKDDVRAGTIIGVPLFVGYATQAVGQQYTSPSNAGFITGLFVVATPVIATILYRTIPSWPAVTGVALATLGLYLLAAPSGHLHKGDALLLGTAVAFAFHVMAIGHLSPGRSALRLVAVQSVVAAIIATAWTLGAEHHRPPGADAGSWFVIALTGVFATAVGFFVQTRAQQHTSPTRTAVILTAEPVFAGIFGYVLAGDRLGARGYAGAALIVAAIVVSEFLAPEMERV
jgi:drug/metabolite transporter (DMT)-like permease